MTTKTTTMHEQMALTANQATDGNITYSFAAANAITSDASPGRRVFSLPNWYRHGTQPRYWSEIWRQKEILADLDILAGNVFESGDVDELIARLEAAAGR